MRKLNPGFFTALGTPLDENGNLVASALVKQIEMQIEAGASGLLLLGSMGIEEAVNMEAYAEAAKVASEANNGRVALFVGVMDNSISRVKARLELLRGLKLDGVVATTPFYCTSTDSELFSFFSSISDASEHPLYLYDLAVVTKVKINFPLVDSLIKAGKVAGIKTGDIVLVRQLKFAYPDFNVLYSNLDCFDVALKFGFDKVLDGMFSCTPKNAKGLADAYRQGDFEGVSKYLNNIIWYRDRLLAYPGTDLLYIYSESMNLLGLDGIYVEDYKYTPMPELIDSIKADMQKIGEI